MRELKLDPLPGTKITATSYNHHIIASSILQIPLDMQRSLSHLADSSPISKEERFSSAMVLRIISGHSGHIEVTEEGQVSTRTYKEQIGIR